MQIGSNTPLISTNPSHSVQQSTHVDESLFVPQGSLPDEAYINSGEASIFFNPTTPEDAWQQHAYSGNGSMVNVATTIPAGYQDVASQLDKILTEGGIEAPPEMTIRFAIPQAKPGESEVTAKTPLFIVENIENDALIKQIEEILNSNKNDHFKEGYLALDKLTATENTQLAQQRDRVIGLPANQKATHNEQQTDSIISYGYKQDFSLRLNSGTWLMDTNIQSVELMRLEKATSKY